jgi:hypothetical protein
MLVSMLMALAAAPAERQPEAPRDRSVAVEDGAQPQQVQPAPEPEDVISESYRRFFWLYWLVPLIQVVALIHAVRTGRGREWAWIILVLPGVGAAAYLFAEVMPGLRASADGRLWDGLLNALMPRRELAILYERVRVSDTTANRKALAAGYLRHGNHREAVETYRSCLQGPLKDDAETTLELCRALFLAGQAGESRDLLDALKKSHPRYEPARRDLLYARALEALGRTAEALPLYAAAAGNPRFEGEEARCRYAALLESTGQPDAARAIYGEVLERSKGFARHFRQSQRPWIAWARQGLKRTRRAESRRTDEPRKPMRDERRR